MVAFQCIFQMSGDESTRRTLCFKHCNRVLCSRIKRISFQRTAQRCKCIVGFALHEVDLTLSKMCLFYVCTTIIEICHNQRGNVIQSSDCKIRLVGAKLIP